MMDVSYDPDPVIDRMLAEAHRDFPGWEFARTEKGWKAAAGECAVIAPTIMQVVKLLPSSRMSPV